MSRRRHKTTKARACTGKEAMCREDAAGKSARMNRSVGAEDDALLYNAYHCGHCDNWHIGHVREGKR